MFSSLLKKTLEKKRNKKIINEVVKVRSHQRAIKAPAPLLFLGGEGGEGEGRRVEKKKNAKDCIRSVEKKYVKERVL